MGSRYCKIISSSHWSNVICSLIGRNKVWFGRGSESLRISAKPNILYKNMRKRCNVVLHGEVHAVDQGVVAHQQVQPLPELQEQE